MASKNQLVRAKKVLTALIEGINPADGSELARDSIIHDIDVNRALTVAARALDDQKARAERRAQLPSNVGKGWGDAEERTLVAAYQSGDPIPQIAARHGRTVRAIESRLVRLKLLNPEERSTGDIWGPKLQPLADPDAEETE
jgi:plasmid stability protein